MSERINTADLVHLLQQELHAVDPRNETEEYAEYMQYMSLAYSDADGYEY